MTHLINHVGEEALHLVSIQCLLTPKTDGRGELGDGNPGSANRRRARLLRLVVPASDKHFAQKIAQRDVATTLQRQIDAPLDELLLPLLESEVEGVELAFLDAPAEGQEELLQTRIGLQELLARECVGRKEMAWDKVGEDQSVAVVSTACAWLSEGLAALEAAHSLFLFASLWQIFQASVRCFSACWVF